MRAPVILKVPGIASVELEKLLNFINSDANRPFDYTRGNHGPERSPHLRYVKLLDIQIEPSEDDSNPSFEITLHVLTEHGMRRKPGDAGFDESEYDDSRHETPRSVLVEVFDRLAVFTK